MLAPLPAQTSLTPRRRSPSLRSGFSSTSSTSFTSSTSYSLFSVTSTRFAIHNSAQPFSFVTTPHVSRKTPGVRLFVTNSFHFGNLFLIKSVRPGLHRSLATPIKSAPLAANSLPTPCPAHSYAKHRGWVFGLSKQIFADRGFSKQISSGRVFPAQLCWTKTVLTKFFSFRECSARHNTPCPCADWTRGVGTRRGKEKPFSLYSYYLEYWYKRCVDTPHPKNYAGCTGARCAPLASRLV